MFIIYFLADDHSSSITAVRFLPAFQDTIQVCRPVPKYQRTKKRSSVSSLPILRKSWKYGRFTLKIGLVPDQVPSERLGFHFCKVGNFSIGLKGIRVQPPRCQNHRGHRLEYWSCSASWPADFAGNGAEEAWFVLWWRLGRTSSRTGSNSKDCSAASYVYSSCCYGYLALYSNNRNISQIPLGVQDHYSSVPCRLSSQNIHWPLAFSSQCAADRPLPCLAQYW